VDRFNCYSNCKNARCLCGDNSWNRQCGFCKNLGADEVIDYKVQDVTDVLRDYDAVFDTAGGDRVNELFKIIKEGGTLVSMVAGIDQDLANKQGTLLVNDCSKH